MGCGASNQQQQQNETDTVDESKLTEGELKFKRQADKWSQKYNEAQKKLDQKTKECQRLKGEVTPMASPLTPVKSKIVAENFIEVVVNADQLRQLSELNYEDLAISYVQGTNASPCPDFENVVIVNCSTDRAAEVLKICQAPKTVVKRAKPPPEAPPPLDATAEEKKEEEEPKEEPDKPKVPKATLEATTSLEWGKWDGKVELTFTWTHEPSPYSEYDDPSGSNWWPQTNVRKAPFIPPKEIILQYRQGMNGEWTDIKAELTPTGAQAKLKIAPEAITGSAFRGFQSRWVLDGEKYLTPLQLAPTLQSKLMTFPAVRDGLKNLPKEKRILANLPNAHVRDACLAIENIIPMNTWDFTYGITLTPGAYLNGEHCMTFTEKVEKIAKDKLNSPAVKSELRKTCIKAPVMAVSALAGTVGLSLSAVVDNMDFFLPKMNEPAFDVLEQAEADMDEWETIRREMQIDANEKYPVYQNGVRVSFPPARVLRYALQAKRPVATIVKYPIDLLFKLREEADFTKLHKVEFVCWRLPQTFSDQTVAELKPEEKEEKLSAFSSDMTKTWNNYALTVQLEPGTYRYYWTFDGKPFFNDGAAFGETFKPEDSQLEFLVEGHIEFGIGIVM